MSTNITLKSNTGPTIVLKSSSGPQGPPGSLTAAGAFVLQDGNTVWWKFTVSTDGWLQSALATEEDLEYFGITGGGLI